LRGINCRVYASHVAFCEKVFLFGLKDSDGNKTQPRNQAV
jgi:hypothetical protein